MRFFSILVTAAALWLGFPRSASAQQAAAATPADFTLPTTSGRAHSIREFRGRVTVLFYETRDTVRQNEHVKDAIAQWARTDPAVAERYALVVVVNVGEFNHFPANHFARGAIETVSRQQHLDLWLDWDRSLVRRLGMRDGASNVAVLDRTGRMRFSRAGALSPADLASLLTMLSTLAAEP